MQEPDIDDLMGPELFPTCECYTSYEGAKQNRGVMYHRCHEHASMMLARAQMDNMCPEAIVHVAAQTIHMLMGLVASMEVTADGAAHDETGKAAYCQTIKGHHDRIKQLLDLHMARSYRVMIADGTGADVVQ